MNRERWSPYFSSMHQNTTRLYSTYTTIQYSDRSDKYSKPWISDTTENPVAVVVVFYEMDPSYSWTLELIQISIKIPGNKLNTISSFYKKGANFIYHSIHPLVQCESLIIVNEN